MSHQPPIPEAAQSPYPLQPEPIADRETPAPVQSQTEEAAMPAAEVLQPANEESWADRARGTIDQVRETVDRAGAAKVGLAAAVGIGSAAVLAAVMFTRRRGSAEPAKRPSEAQGKGGAKSKPRSKAAGSKRELIEPTPGDKRFVRRKADGTFGKSVEVGKSLAADRRVKAKRTAKPGQGDRGDQKD